MTARRILPATLFSLLLAAGLLACSGVQSGIFFGANRNGARVTKPTRNFSIANGPIFFEVDSSKKFGGTTMTIQVLQKNGSGEKIVDSVDVQVPADDNIYSLPLTPSAYGAGYYRLSASINGNAIASGLVTFTP